MGQVFPLVYETSRLRAILGILKQNGGSIELSKLAEETDEQVDDLLPLIEALKVLGFASVDESVVKITAQGKKVTLGNVMGLIKKKLVGIEPFMSAIKILKSEKEMSTEALFERLSSQGMSLHWDKATNEAMLKKMFLRFGVRSKLLYYDSERDIWSLPSRRP
ncbi:MAG: AAA-associated domain-containing protein [Candidatus Micrarchaeaceae archaeon]